MPRKKKTDDSKIKKVKKSEPTPTVSPSPEPDISFLESVTIPGSLGERLKLLLASDTSFEVLKEQIIDILTTAQKAGLGQYSEIIKKLGGK